ncbi:fimbrial protein [Enterobacter kobei]|uniref:fimbrial protein n=1 Tax=Enterobacter kobei TaxID=208224 RepID=UPI003A983272
MKKISKIALITLLAITPTISNAMAEDGTIDFNGAVRDSTCEIKAGGDGVTSGAGTADFTVTLPTVAVTALDGIGKTAGEIPFYIALSGTTCTNGNAKLYFEPASSQAWISDSGDLKNDVNPTTGGGADKVEVRLTDKSKNKINVKTVNSEATALTQTIANNKAQFDFYAMYVSTAAAVKAGTVHSRVIYSISYP